LLPQPDLKIVSISSSHQTKKETALLTDAIFTSCWILQTSSIVRCPNYIACPDGGYARPWLWAVRACLDYIGMIRSQRRSTRSCTNCILYSGVSETAVV